MIKLALLFLSVLAYGQEPTLCGTNHTNTHANYIHVGCVDYELLRKVAPGIPWPAGTSTQVVIHAKQPGFVKVTIGGVTEYAEFLHYEDGRFVAMVTFVGTNHTKLEIKFGTWLDSWRD